MLIRKYAIFLLLVTSIPLYCTIDKGDRYIVENRRTSYGIPHVKADDWGGMGYEFAYATATVGTCV